MEQSVPINKQKAGDTDTTLIMTVSSSPTSPVLAGMADQTEPGFPIFLPASQQAQSSNIIVNHAWQKRLRAPRPKKVSLMEGMGRILEEVQKWRFFF